MNSSPTGCILRTAPSRILISAFWAAVLLAASAAAPAAEPEAVASAGLVRSAEPGWPQWRGPKRDGICDETGLLDRWPAEGPKLLWKFDQLGRGWSSPIIARNRLYITGDVGERLVVFAFDLEGKLLWRAANGRAWAKPYPGARACCLLDEGKLYHMNAHGRVACLDAATGKELWAVNVLERFEGKVIRWGMSECLLIDGPRLIVTPGGRKSVMAALDKATGRTVWASEPLGTDDASYASPILFRWGGGRHLVNCSSGHVFGVDADTGRLQWRRPRPTRYQAIATTPLYHAGHVLAASPDGRTAELFKLTVDGAATRAEAAWLSPMVDMSGAFVYRDGRLYGSGYRGMLGWACLDFRTGKVLYRLEDLPRGAHVLADGLLHCVSEEGEVALLAPGEEAFEVRGRFRLASPTRPDFWAHPVVHDRRLYIRYHETFWCFDVRAPR